MTDDVTDEPTRVLIVDDEALISAGLEMLLDAADGVQVVGIAGNGREAVRRVDADAPDIVLMDLRMPVLDGVGATAEITTRHPETRVLALPTFADEALMYDALRAGAHGYLLKQAAPAQLLEAIRRIVAGGAWIDPDMAPGVIETLRTRALHAGDATVITATLTPREQHILTLVADGQSNQEIRDALVLSEATVKTHVARILMKTGSRDRAAAVALAWKSGFLPRSPGSPSAAS